MKCNCRVQAPRNYMATRSAQRATMVLIAPGRRLDYIKCAQAMVRRLAAGAAPLQPFPPLSRLLASAGKVGRA